MADDRAERLAHGVAAEFRRRMLDEYVPRIEGCVRQLSAAELWHRANPQCNSVGNLLLHLAGNVRQWIQCGIRGDTDLRNRDSEFAAGDGFALSDGQ